ncbi:MAG: YaaC family protein [Myxacorys chilensis ATA2-1-KO14]|jgi:hypothetical protein|nr:YaaC family protein [Myxacorys chilensis ATA2-1-KO14]
MGDPWEVLINYESNELVRRRYKEIHNREANAAHALEISASFSQGAAYFSSAKNADRVVRPLLLYYGVLSLARGTAIFLRRGIREASLSPAHGLSTVNWGQTLAQSNSDIGDIRIRVTKDGSIHEFAEATGNQTLMRISKSAINQTSTHDTLVNNQEFTLSDILSRFPELMQQYIRWRSDGRCAIGGVEESSPAGSVIIRINKKWGTFSANHDLVKRVVEHLDVLSIQEAPDFWHVSIGVPLGEVASERNIPGHWDYVPSDGFGIGFSCLVGRYPGGWLGSKPVALFLLAYILGMLARYFPSQWTSLVRNYGNDAASPTLLSAMDTIERQFPQTIADFLDRSALNS